MLQSKRMQYQRKKIRKNIANRTYYDPGCEKIV